MAMSFAVTAIFLVAAALLQQPCHARTQVGYYCMPDVNDEAIDFKVVFTINENGFATITGARLMDYAAGSPYSTAIDMIQDCPSAVFDNNALQTGIHQFTFEQDLDTSVDACGKGSTGTTQHNFAVQLIRDTGEGDTFLIQCDTADLLQDEMEVTSFSTTPVEANKFTHYNPHGVNFNLVQADGDSVPFRPGKFVELGENVKLRLTLNKGYPDSGPTNMGRRFTIAVPKHGDGAILQIVTTGLGTNVEITAGNPSLEIFADVRRDDAFEYHIPDAYRLSAATDTVPEDLENVLVVRSYPDPIGVRVINYDASSRSSYLAIPDETLISSFDAADVIQYKLSSVFAGSQLLIYPVEGTTNIDFASAGAYVPSSQGFADDTNAADLDYGFRKSIICTADCTDVSFDSDEPFGITMAAPASDGNSATQLYPYFTYHTEFVLFDAGVSYHVTDDGSGTSIQHESSGLIPPVATAPTMITPAGLTELTSADPVSVIMSMGDSGSNDGIMLSVPSVAQWSPRQYVYLTEGYQYDIHIIGYKGELADIQVILGSIQIDFSHSTLGEDTAFNTLVTDVAPIAVVGEASNYEVYKNTVDFRVSDTSPALDSGIVEFKTAATMRHRPFGVIVYERDGSGNLLSAYTGYGTRFPDTASCTPTTATGLPASFTSNFYVGAGDGIDNDCDGLVDEETNFNTDTDGDGLIDEDLALGDTQPLAIYVDHLIDVDVGGYIISGGCNVAAQGSPFADIGDFTQNTNLHPVFSDLWVLETNVFNAYKLVNLDQLHFDAHFGYCFGDETATQERCQTSCVSRRKRDVTNNVTDADMYVQMTWKLPPRRMNATSSNSNYGAPMTSSETGSQHPCERSLVYWVPHMILTVAMFVQIGGLIAMFKIKYKHA